VKGYFFFCDPGTPHYPDWSYFGSRNWHKGDGSPIPPYGELENAKQAWRDGSFPTVKPDATLIGDQSCIENGNHVGPQPVALIAGVDIRCWAVRPPWGGIELGGNSHARPIHGGLALGGSSHAAPIAGGLALGGRGHAAPIAGGLALGGRGHAAPIAGGLALGGRGRSQIVLGGLALGGRGRSQVVLGGLALGGSSHEESVSGGLALGGKSHAAPILGGLALGGKSHAAPILGGLALGGAGTFSVSVPLSIRQFGNNGANGANPNSASITWPGATVAGNLLVAVVSAYGVAPVTMSAPAGWVLASQNNQTNLVTRIYYLANAASQTVTGNFTANYLNTTASLLSVVTAEVVGAPASSPLDVNQKTATGTASPASTALTGTLAQASEIIIAGVAFAVSAGSASAPTNGFTIGVQRTQGGGLTSALLYKIVSVVTSTSTGCAIGGAVSVWGTNIVSFK
jgi:hypothetical protein